MNVISEDYAKEKCFFEDLTEGKVIVMSVDFIANSRNKELWAKGINSYC